MTDGVIKSTGNSRYLKSVANFMTLFPTYEDFAAALVAGNLPIDLNGINPDGWNQQATPLNKANLLADTTGAMLGLGSTATPNQALAKLGQYNQYWWRRYPISKKTAKTIEVIKIYPTTTPTRTVEYSNSISYNGSIFSLVSPSKLSVPYGSASTILNALTGKYFKSNNIIYFSAGSPSKTTSGNEETYMCSGQEIYLGTPSYVNGGNSPSTYPNPGISGNYYYEAVGRPLEWFKHQDSIRLGYTGTGNYGSSNPPTIAFPFSPKFIIISAESSYFHLSVRDSAAYFKDWVMWSPGNDTLQIYCNAKDSSYGGIIAIRFSFSGNTLRIYTDSSYSFDTSDAQLNRKGVYYNVVALA